MIEKYFLTPPLMSILIEYFGFNETYFTIMTNYDEAVNQKHLNHVLVLLAFQSFVHYAIMTTNLKKV